MDLDPGSPRPIISDEAGMRIAFVALALVSSTWAGYHFLAPDDVSVTTAATEFAQNFANGVVKTSREGVSSGDCTGQLPSSPAEALIFCWETNKTNGDQVYVEATMKEDPERGTYMPETVDSMDIFESAQSVENRGKLVFNLSLAKTIGGWSINTFTDSHRVAQFNTNPAETTQRIHQIDKHGFSLLSNQAIEIIHEAFNNGQSPGSPLPSNGGGMLTA